MIDNDPIHNTSLTDLKKADWLNAVSSLSEDVGFFEKLGDRHYAWFVEGSETLLVTFESLHGISALSPQAKPLGWEMMHDYGWSSLCIASDGDTWFRDEAVFTYIDKLADEGFFDTYDKVVFYGAGPGAYAAAAFSVAAPGSCAVLIQPQATLDTKVSEWDDRFPNMRRTDFTSRYGYAPDMLEAAEKAFILYDPHERLDAVHASLFSRPNVIRFKMPFLGSALQTHLMRMGQLGKLLDAAVQNNLDSKEFARLYRNRRLYRPYLRRLLIQTNGEDRPNLMLAVLRHGAKQLKDPRFIRKLREYETD